MSLTAVMSMLIDPGNTSAGSAQVSTFGRSKRLFNIEDVSLMRMCAGAQVTTPFSGDSAISYTLEYSPDSTDGANGTWAALIPPIGPFGTIYEVKYTDWVSNIPQDARDAQDVWLRIAFAQFDTGGATSASFIEIQYR